MKKLICICLVLLLLSGCSADLAAYQSEPTGGSQAPGVSIIFSQRSISVEGYSEYLALFQAPAKGKMVGQDWVSPDRFELYCEDLASGVRSLTVPYLGDAPMAVDQITVCADCDKSLHQTWFSSRDALGIDIVLREYAEHLAAYIKEKDILDFLKTALPRQNYNYISRDMGYKPCVTTVDIGGIPTEVYCYREQKNVVKMYFVSGDFLVEIWDWGGKGAQELLAGFSLQPLKEIP